MVQSREFHQTGRIRTGENRGGRAPRTGLAPHVFQPAEDGRLHGRLVNSVGTLTPSDRIGVGNRTAAISLIVATF